MSGYLYFKATGNEKIDHIVSLLNDAGNAYHHTDGWHEEIEYYDGKTYHELLQDALNEAATNNEIARLREALRFYADTDEDDGGVIAREALKEGSDNA